MTYFDEAVLTMTISRIQARERLDDPQYCGRLEITEFYNLLIQAGCNEKEAQRAANERGWQRLLEGLPV